MSWVNPPPSVSNYRDALIACTTVANTILNGLTLPQQQARFHYPRADFRTDTLPAFVISRIRTEGERGDQGGTFGRGQVIAHLYVSDTVTDDGTLEQWADAIVQDLTSLTTNDTLYVIRAEAGDAIEPSPAMVAGAVSGQPDDAGLTFRVISITADWEG